jgi:hypothetical protein
LLELLKDFEGYNGYTVRIDIDHRVAYAYMLLAGEIVAEVWLFNVGRTPLAPDKVEGSDPPRNPEQYASTNGPPENLEAGEVACRWGTFDGVTLVCEVLLRGAVFGRLWPGARPGEAKLAAVAGPFARVLGDRSMELLD